MTSCTSDYPQFLMPLPAGCPVITEPFSAASSGESMLRRSPACRACR